MNGLIQGCFVSQYSRLDLVSCIIIQLYHKKLYNVLEDLYQINPGESSYGRATRVRDYWPPPGGIADMYKTYISPVNTENSIIFYGP